MAKLKLLFSGKAGFTLVELMVVVAIIGILSSVAIPNFKKYQAKSRTAEARVQLAALYSAEQAAFGEYDTYATCLSLMGYNPAAEFENRRYAMGFNAANAAGTDAAAVTNGLAGCATGSTFLNSATAALGTAYFGYGANKRMNGEGANTAADLPDSVNTTTTFTAGAGGYVSPDAAAAMTAPCSAVLPWGASSRHCVR